MTAVVCGWTCGSASSLRAEAKTHKKRHSRLEKKGSWIKHCGRQKNGLDWILGVHEVVKMGGGSPTRGWIYVDQELTSQLWRVPILTRPERKE